jgi:hypothetical protein
VLLSLLGAALAAVAIVYARHLPRRRRARENEKFSVVLPLAPEQATLGPEDIHSI